MCSQRASEDGAITPPTSRGETGQEGSAAHGLATASSQGAFASFRSRPSSGGAWFPTLAVRGAPSGDSDCATRTCTLNNWSRSVLRVGPTPWRDGDAGPAGCRSPPARGAPLGCRPEGLQAPLLALKGSRSPAGRSQRASPGLGHGLPWALLGLGALGSFPSHQLGVPASLQLS